MLAKTIRSEQIWQSPDKQKTIWQVVMEADNRNAYALKTYSARIATLGFEGEVESYVNKRGDRFVRQVQKAHAPTETNRDSTIQAEWAIGQAIALASATMDKQHITMPVIERYAKDLFATVSRVKGEEQSPKAMREAEQYIQRFANMQNA